MGFSAGGSQVLFEMTRFAGHAEQLFSQAYVMSPGFVPGAGHEHAEAFFLFVPHSPSHRSPSSLFRNPPVPLSR